MEAAWGNSKQGLSRKYTEFCSVHASLSRQQQKTVWSSVVIEQETRKYQPMRFRLRAEPRCLRKTFLQEYRDRQSQELSAFEGPDLILRHVRFFFSPLPSNGINTIGKDGPSNDSSPPPPPFLSLGTEVRGTKTNFQHFPINVLPWPLSWPPQSSFF